MCREALSESLLALLLGDGVLGGNSKPVRRIESRGGDLLRVAAGGEEEREVTG